MHIRSSIFTRMIYALVALLLCLFQRTPVSAQGVTAQLGIRPVGSNDSFIQLTLDPGATQDLAIELGNYGTESVVANTFLADVYSLVNGGMGVSLEATTGDGISGWIDYPPQTLTLDARSALQRNFTLHIPDDIQPGEYLTSIVLQGEASAPSAGEGVALKQVVRQAMAISVTVPGPQVAALSIGEASSREVAGHTYVRINLRNTGNVRIQPQGDLVLYDATGAEVSRYPVKMGSIYAGTETMLEVPFAGVLHPGSYTIGLALHDSVAGDLAKVDALSMQIAAPVEPTAAPVNEGSNQAPINQAPINQPTDNQVAGNQEPIPAPTAGLNIPLDVLFAGGLVLLFLLAFVPMFRRRRR